jgi:cytochrome c oxidase subunit 2
MPTWLVRAAALLPLGLSNCSGWQSALDPKGPQAAHLADLIWWFVIICTIVWLLVMLALGYALLRGRAPRPDPLHVDPSAERRAWIVVSAAVVATTVIVIALTALSFVSQRKLYAKTEPAVTILLTGKQWWWDIRYEGAPDRTFTTANEIVIPAGAPVTIKLASSDVIHSVWVPNLFGKQDLIPGQENEIQFVAEKPGIYRGQCAEFCGWQHAHMGLLVIAMPQEQFEGWREAQVKAAEPPSEPERVKGQEIFLSKACVMCHTVRGTLAGSRAGPDLTHFGSRQTIASATLSMSRGNLAAWLVDPQGIKPGVNMPNVTIEPDELDPLLSFLTGLK